MTTFSCSTRPLVALGLAAIALSTVASDASAFPGRGFGGARGGVIGGGFRGGGFGGRLFGGGRIGGGGFGIRGPIGIRPLPIPVRIPPRHPPIVRGPHFPPGPPFVPGRPWPHPIWPPIVINHHPHHWPIIPVGGPVPIPPVITVGGYRAATPGVAVAPAPSAPVGLASGPACGPSGSFVSVVFLPTATIADVNAFLKTYNVTVADGPTVDGIYRIRLSDVPLPTNRILELVTSMRSQVAIVSDVES